MMSIRTEIASSVLSLLAKQFGGELKDTCLKGKFAIDRGDVDIHVEFCGGGKSGPAVSRLRKVLGQEDD